MTVHDPGHGPGQDGGQVRVTDRGDPDHPLPTTPIAFDRAATDLDPTVHHHAVCPELRPTLCFLAERRHGLRVCWTDST